ncbi:MAG TPA: Trp biosynthesis-associated membrane protein [Mycobacteriales bacterium]|nr:Trp biosynthesis-associated membrane protein [Mycobacteriales bacterium]
MTGRRGLVGVLTGWVLAGALLLIASGRQWGSATVRSATGAQVHAQVSGHDVAASLAPLGGALLALALLAFAVRGWGRRVSGLLAAAVGAGAAVAAIHGDHGVGAALAQQAFAAQVRSVDAPATGWPWLCVVAGVLAAGAGLLTVALAGRWGGLGRRYDAPGAQAAAQSVAPGDDDASRWAALDRGEDPTA